MKLVRAAERAWRITVIRASFEVRSVAPTLKARGSEVAQIGPNLENPSLPRATVTTLVTVERRLCSSVGLLLDRGFIESFDSGGLSSGRRTVSTPGERRYIPPSRIGATEMSHTTQEKEKRKLLMRLKRIRGQLDAVERRIEEDSSCSSILQQATACRGALDGFIAEVIEDHILEHLVDASAPKDDARAQAAEELVEIVHSYFR